MTITHEVDREEVMAYLDEELSTTRAVVVRAHLDQCAECRALADELREVSAGLGEWMVEPAPPIGLLGHRAFGLLKGAPGRAGDSRFRFNWRWSAVAASAAGLAVVALTWGALGTRSAIPVVVTGGADDSIATAARSASSRGPRQDERGGQATRALGYVSAPSGTNAQQGQQGGSNSSPTQAAANTQLIVRTATVSLSTEKFDDVRAALERVAAAHQGSVEALTLAGDPPNRRSLSATVRVPIAGMDATLTDVRALGRVLQESQSSEDVTDAHRDLAIRISNSKIEEARLGEILKNRTGRLSDVLAVEQAQSRVRTEIEQMEAQELAMRNRATLSTISVQIDERYRAELADIGPLPIGTRLRNAVVDGARAALESLVGVTLAVLGAAPTLILWIALLFLPARWIVRWVRRRATTTWS